MNKKKNKNLIIPLAVGMLTAVVLMFALLNKGLDIGTNVVIEFVLKDAEIYSDRYFRQTCLAQIQVCLEDNCATATNSACLSDVNVAAGICPIIGECEEKIPGIQTVVNDKLGYLRTRFCQNDVDSCLREMVECDHKLQEIMNKTAFELFFPKMKQ